jgi:hypothetical protein
MQVYFFFPDVGMCKRSQGLPKTEFGDLNTQLFSTLSEWRTGDSIFFVREDRLFLFPVREDSSSITQEW